MTLLVRDEEDIVGSQIDFHLSRGVDHVIAMDNLSVDGTRAILGRYEAQGRLTYLHQAGDDHAQGRWVSEMARRAYRDQGADWVINADADEFWWPAAGDLKSTLSEVASEVRALQVERTNFIPSRTPSSPNFAEAMTVRWCRSLNTLGRPLPPKVCHRGLEDVTVAQGNHAASDGRGLIETAPASILILHFPVRTYAQFSRKIAVGGAAYARNTHLPPSAGETWRRLYEAQRQGRFARAYEEIVPDDATVDAGLASGRLVRDLRLRDALAELRVAA